MNLTTDAKSVRASGWCRSRTTAARAGWDQGISEQGNRRVRALAIEMAWMWLRHQRESALSQWFARRTQGSGKRIAIVAVARRLVIDLWRYLKDGVVPAGALLKAL